MLAMTMIEMKYACNDNDCDDDAHVPEVENRMMKLFNDLTPVVLATFREENYVPS